MRAGEHSTTRDEFDRLFDKVKNWGRWGEGDELGTLNFLGDADVARAASLVQTGRRVSLGRPFDTASGPDNPRPALHYMTCLGDGRSDEPSFYMDFVGIDFHGKSASHIDALAHVAYKGLLYNGRPASTALGSAGTVFAPISSLARGVITRGVLLDAPRARGIDWIEPPAALGADDLEAVATSQQLQVARGDAVLVRTGLVRRRRALGPWDPGPQSVGLGLSAMEWLAEREVALLGSDGDSDARPAGVEGVSEPIHVLAIVAMGMCLLDNLDLEALSDACAEAGRYEFLLVVAPLIVAGGTGSPVNPLAVF
jgi:kynurenine formamidase